MQGTFEINKATRELSAQFLEKYTLEELNKTPEGYNNNLIWNIGHIIVTQQLLVYKLSGLPMMVSDEMIERYSKGTRPERDVTQEEVAILKSLLFSTIEQLETDSTNNLFVNYQTYPTSAGVVLK